ncbi:flagellar hook-basal body complex protein FliE [Pueribacillus theae]|uniref:Flagellar hook-basal body complex protein FliE n=1 Tax=Pueribacillus theae TaxID=2171751 RepID=A0A2U1K7J9_9BACI|nr:flagellar hook-basal body complex protein FliE [Pueribacillus theae]PWA13500.1 flagellar hook-basal body complex protein FliE [Pueribacillus theae]
MEKFGITPLIFNQKPIANIEVKKTPFDVQQQFSQMLSNAMNKVNDAQAASDKETKKLIENKAVNLHDVMITAEKASVSMQVALEIRNKAIEAYQEIMRMPL